MAINKTLSISGNLIGEMITSANFEVTSLEDGDVHTHSLNSTKLKVSFFDADGIEQYDIRWAPNDADSIYIYLPALESGTNTFTGDIFYQLR